MGSPIRPERSVERLGCQMVDARQVVDHETLRSGNASLVKTLSVDAPVHVDRHCRGVYPLKVSISISLPNNYDDRSRRQYVRPASPHGT